jgi:hypothetical protein
MRNTVPVLLERFVSPHHTEPTLASDPRCSLPGRCSLYPCFDAMGHLHCAERKTHQVLRAVCSCPRTCWHCIMWNYTLGACVYICDHMYSYV